jgi:hypothetical protein
VLDNIGASPANVGGTRLQFGIAPMLLSIHSTEKHQDIWVSLAKNFIKAPLQSIIDLTLTYESHGRGFCSYTHNVV